MKQNERVLLITENLGSGGAERQLTLLAVLLKSRGYDVKVLTYGEVLFYLPYLQANNVEHIFLKQARNKWIRVFSFVKAFHKYKPTAIISFLPSTNMACCLARLFYKAKFIVSERSHTIKSAKSMFMLKLYKLADLVVTNSYSEAENLAGLAPGLSNKLRTIVNAVDNEKFRPALTLSDNNPKRIICVGRVIPYKNILNFIEAINIVRNEGLSFQVDWFGKQYDKVYVQKVLDKIKDLDCGDIFSLHEPSEVIQKEYQQSDIFCLPSYLEGYPNVIVEAMSCGLPVICSNICDNSHIVKDKENGFLFNPNDVSSIVIALKKILQLEVSELHSIGQKNRDKVIKENSEENFVRKYIDLL
ncbi:glycosyltransferase family 4 protein [uncultured Bacteroides sp.]|uniref:glycosyltransferase family 4 protein n=1 Tax=uncultured Bacteroides sp. TaxID=162156 RepID=UPI0026760918|nr:glycosyltransferase family 4 protein [uncultured Bacteroides sp.]